MSMTPMNREEVFLNGIASGDEVTLEPMTREEAWLQAIINGYTDKLIPMTHKEMFYRQWLDASLVSPVWKGLNPVVVDSHEETVKLADTGFATWTPSTTKTQVYAEKTLFTKDIDVEKYDYIVDTQFLLDLKYNDGDDLKASRLYRSATSAPSFIMRVNKLNKTQSAPLYGNTVPIYWGAVVYTNSSSAARINSITGVGLAPDCPTISIASANDAQTSVTVNQSVIKAVCDSSMYFSTATASLVDKDKSTFTISTTLYRFNKGTSYFGAVNQHIHEMLTKDAPWGD